MCISKYSLRLTLKNFILMLVIFGSAMMQSCRNDLDYDQGIRTIKLAEAYRKRAPILISSFAAKIEYVQLQTTSETFYRGVPVVFTIGDSLLLIKAHQRISLFDRNTGDFLREIAHSGEDPGGYLSSMTTFGVNERNFSTYAKGWKYRIYEYSLTDGRLLNKINKPEASSGAVKSIALLNENYFVGYIPNFIGSQKLKLVITDFEGALVKTYPNHLSYIDGRKVVSSGREGTFHSFGGDLFFKEYFNDTAFQVSIDELKPRLYFDLNRYSPPYDKKESMSFDEWHSYMFFDRTSENEHFMFWHMRFRKVQYMCYFDKISGKTYVSYDKNNEEKNGFINDLDGFVSFYPEFINKQGEILGLVLASEVVEWFKNNPDKVETLPEHLKKFQNMQPEDNPLVMIAKPK